MKLLPEKVSTYLYHAKVKGMNKKIDNLTCLIDDLRKEAECDPDRAEQYYDSIDEVREQVKIITEELQVVDFLEHQKV
ncbi:MAG: hypothetical protein H9W81_04350 [Enterococcus sp.]|nr:hypothetical protein [Enterococcus sp.]